MSPKGNLTMRRVRVISLLLPFLLLPLFSTIPSKQDAENKRHAERIVRTAGARLISISRNFLFSWPIIPPEYQNAKCERGDGINHSIIARDASRIREFSAPRDGREPRLGKVNHKSRVDRFPHVHTYFACGLCLVTDLTGSGTRSRET